MGKFYCNICEKDVDLVDGKCPKCHTNWDQIIKESVEKGTKFDLEEEFEAEIPKKPREFNSSEVYTENIDEASIKRTIAFYLQWAGIGKAIIIILDIIFFITGLASIGELESGGFIVGILLIITFITIFFFSYIFEHNLKWRAYMLYTNSVKKK